MDATPGSYKRFHQRFLTHGCSTAPSGTPLPPATIAKLAIGNRTWEELRLHDFAAAQAGRANPNALVCLADLGMYRPQIDVPPALRHVMRVADVISELRLLAAHCTHLSHHLLQRRIELEVKLDFTGFEVFSPNPLTPRTRKSTKETNIIATEGTGFHGVLRARVVRVFPMRYWKRAANRPQADARQ
jgi:hypothetical protein